MSKKGYISRYLILLNKLRNDRYCSYQELADYLESQQELLRLGDESLEMALSKRTIQRDFKEIRELFGIDIEYSRKEKGYYIVQSASESLNFQRRLEAFDMINSLNLQDDLSRVVKLESRKPLGTEHIYGFIHAVKHSFIVEFSYKKFLENKATQRICEPYFIKESKNRWYVVAKDRKDNRVKTFALDRISDLLIGREKFTPIDVARVHAKFSNAFGIILSDNQTPSEVVLSFTAFQGKYLKSLPLHHSQQVLVENKNEIRISLNVFITHDFVMELLSYGENLVVLKPDKLKEKIRDSLQKSLDRYK